MSANPTLIANRGCPFTAQDQARNNHFSRQKQANVSIAASSILHDGGNGKCTTMDAIKLYLDPSASTTRASLLPWGLLVG